MVCCMIWKFYLMKEYIFVRDFNSKLELFEIIFMC